MELLSADDVADRTEDIVHLDTQRADRGLDLTVSELFRFTGPGQLDFGGGEFQEAAVERLEPELRSEDDDYGWWELDPGTYLVRYNEGLQLEGGELALVTPLERIERAGARHDAFWLDAPDGPLEAQLTVGSSGVHLKENFRASRLRIWAKHSESV